MRVVSYLGMETPEFLNIIYMNLKDRDSSVDIVTSLSAELQRTQDPIPRGGRDISPQLSDGLWGPTSLLFMGTGPGREAIHSPPSTAQVKITWSYTPITPYMLIA
jgi:hypothetical protein